MHQVSLEDIQSVLNDDRQLQEIAKAAFEEIDTDGSGCIDRTELQEMMTTVSEDLNMPPPTELDIIDVLSEIDNSGDGMISLKEFKKLIREVLENLAENYDKKEAR